MKVTVAVTAWALILVTVPSFVKCNCVTVSVPNFLGIGECLGTTGNICRRDTDGVVDFVVKITTCFFEGLLTADLETQLYLIRLYAEYVLTRITIVINPITVGAICEAINTFIATPGLDLGSLNCDSLALNSSLLCSDDITIGVPLLLNLGQCARKITTTCSEGKPITTNVVISFLQFLGCLTYYLSTNSIGQLFQNFLCDIVRTLRGLVGSEVQTALTPFLPLLAGINPSAETC